MKLKLLAISLILIAFVSIFSFFIGKDMGRSPCNPTLRTNLSCPKPEIDITKKCPKPYCPKPDCPECDQSILKEIIENNAEEHKYQDNDRYDCTQFADELARRLEDKGLEAEARIVTVDCNSRLFKENNCKEYDGLHKIVKADIYIEAVTGEVIDPQNYKSYGLD